MPSFTAGRAGTEGKIEGFHPTHIPPQGESAGRKWQLCKWHLWGRLCSLTVASCGLLLAWNYVALLHTCAVTVCSETMLKCNDKFSRELLNLGYSLLHG